MEITNLYLTPLELQGIGILAQEKSYSIVKRDCHLSTLQLAPFLHVLRRKTGIEDTRNSAECQAYLSKYAEATNGPGPTERELEALKRVSGVGYDIHNFQSFGHRMGLTNEEGAALLASALKSIGVTAKDEREQRVQIRLYLASRDCLPDAQPLTENHLLVLSLYAQGASVPAISNALGASFSEEYVSYLIEQGTLRLGVQARGRGVQRRLVAVALAHREKRAQAEQNDPLF